MRKEILLEATRNGYSTYGCGDTLTIGQLIELLQQYDKDTLVYFSHDYGNSYGSLSFETIWEAEESDDE